MAGAAEEERSPAPITGNRISTRPIDMRRYDEELLSTDGRTPRNYHDRPAGAILMTEENDRGEGADIRAGDSV
jgi:hypothetical protein